MTSMQSVTEMECPYAASQMSKSGSTGEYTGILIMSVEKEQAIL